MTRIVIGVDGSPHSLVAVDLVAGMTWPRPTEVHLVLAHERPTEWASHIPGGQWFPGEDPAIQRALARTLDDLADILRRSGLTVAVRIEPNRPAAALIDRARSVAADLIVVGNRGRGPTASVLLGSVSAEIADHAPCPVLVARYPEVTRLLLATDGSPAADTIPGILGHWPAFRRLPVDVLTVSHPPSSDGAFVTPRTGPSAPVRRDVGGSRQVADRMASRLRAAGWRIGATVIRSGDPADEILHAADDHGCDLIVTGSRGLGDLQRLLLGSVAHQVMVKADQSVLIVRGHVPADAVALEVAQPAQGVGAR